MTGKPEVVDRGVRFAARALVLVLVLLAGVVGIGPAAPTRASAEPSTSPSATPSAPPTAPDEPGSGEPTTADEDPLRVVIDRVSPATLGPKGPLTLTGRVTNRSGDTWTAVNLYAVQTLGVIEDRSALAEAAATTEDALLGTRVTEVGTFDTVDELAPGQSESFRIKVDRALLGIGREPGVYWLGVHALGASPDGRDTIADGRARTFVPVVERPRQDPVQASVVVPLKARVDRDPKGRVTDTGRWAELLGPGGRLTDLLKVSESLVTVSWLVDPAVLDAVQSLADGNPVDPLAEDVAPPEPTDPASPTEPETPQETDGAAAWPIDPTVGDTNTAGRIRAERGGRASRSAGRVRTDPTLTTVSDDLAMAAAVWLDRMVSLLHRHQVLALPYGDLDVSALSTFGDPGRSMVTAAVERSQDVLARHELAGKPVLTSPTGWIRPRTLGLLGNDAVALVADEQVVTDDGSTATLGTVLDADGQRILLTSSGAASGGPDESTALRASSLRQRVLSEAALQRQQNIATGQSSPLTVVLPTKWHPEDVESFFAGMARPWVQWQGVEASANNPASTVGPSVLDYPKAQSRQELPESLVTSGYRAVVAARQVRRVIDGRSAVAEQTERTVYPALGGEQRTHRRQAAQTVDALRQRHRGLLERITVESVSQVILTSDSGSFTATVTNGLDVPVRVVLESAADDLELSNPDLPSIPAGQRRTVRLQAQADRIGVHKVDLYLTDVKGAPIGSDTTLSVRAAKVSWLVWAVMLGGALVLFGAIGMRLLRRWRRSGLAVPQDTTEPTTPDEGPTA